LSDGHLKEAVTADLNAAVYENAVSDGAEPRWLDLDVDLGNGLTDTTDNCVPDSFGPAVLQRNMEPGPS
jgi:hypothetical protein